MKLVYIACSLAHSRGGAAWFQPFAHARNFQETVLFWYSSAYGLCISVLFRYSSAREPAGDEASSYLVIYLQYMVAWVCMIQEL